MFTDRQTALLTDPLDPDNVKARKGPGNVTLSYVEGWHLVDEANRIFGFGNWSRETTMLESLHNPVLVTDPDSPDTGKVVAAFMAKVRVTVWSGDGSRSIVREGCGAARGFAKTAGEAMENALKSAETDAMKRALSSFGNSFGLALYDKAKKNVGKPAERPALPPAAGIAAIDEGFQPKLTTSQRALQVSRNGNGKRHPVDLGNVPA